MPRSVKLHLFLSLLFHKQLITPSFSALTILGNISVQLFLQLDTDLTNLQSRYSWANWLVLLYHLAFTVRSRFDGKSSFAMGATEGKNFIYICFSSSTSKCLKTLSNLHFTMITIALILFPPPFVWLFPLNKLVGSKCKFSLRNWCIFNCSTTEHPNCIQKRKSTNISVLWTLVLKFQLIILKSMSCRQNCFLYHYHFLYHRKNFPSSYPPPHTFPSNEASCAVLWTLVNPVSSRWQKQIVLQGKQWGFSSQACKQDRKLTSEKHSFF